MVSSPRPRQRTDTIEDLIANFGLGSSGLIEDVTFCHLEHFLPLSRAAMRAKEEGNDS
jgi:hypothetical protein